MPGHAVEQLGLARSRQVGFGQRLLDFLLGRAVEHRGRELHAQRLRRPAEVGFENLTDVHTAGHAERIEHDFDRRSIRQIRHVFFRQNARDDALVTVAAGHLVAHRKLALHGDVDLDQLDYARRQFVALAQLGDLLVGDLFEHRDLARRHLFDFVDLFVEARVFVGKTHALQVARFHLLDRVAGRARVSLREQPLVGLFVVQVGQHFLAFEQIAEALGALVGQDADFVLRGCAADAGSAFLRCAFDRSSFSCPLREKILQSTTVPSMPGGQ